MGLLVPIVKRPVLLAVTRHAVKLTDPVNVNQAIRMISTASVIQASFRFLFLKISTCSRSSLIISTFTLTCILVMSVLIYFLVVVMSPRSSGRRITAIVIPIIILVLLTLALGAGLWYR